MFSSILVTDVRRMPVKGNKTHGIILQQPNDINRSLRSTTDWTAFPVGWSSDFRKWHVASYRFHDEIASLSARSGYDRIDRTAGIGRK
jgi:hypothetical protein